MLVGVWLGLLWVLFYFFDHYIQSSTLLDFTDLYHTIPFPTIPYHSARVLLVADIRTATRECQMMMLLGWARLYGIY